MEKKYKSLIIENNNLKLEYVEVVAVPAKNFSPFKKYEAEIKDLCDSTGLLLVDTPLGYFCQSNPVEIYLENSATEEQSVKIIIDDSDRNFAIAIHEGKKRPPAILTGVKNCFSNNLKIGYSAKHNRLYCIDPLMSEHRLPHNEL